MAPEKRDVETAVMDYSDKVPMPVRVALDPSPMGRISLEDLSARVSTLEAGLLRACNTVPAEFNSGYRADSHALTVANPAPLGLYAFGLTTILLQGAVTGWTEPQTSYITYGFALFYGGLAQFCAGMWELWRNNMFAAVAFSSYGAFWMAFAVYNILALAGPLKGAGVQNGGAMMLFLWGIFTFILWCQTFRMNAGLNALFLSLTLTFLLLGSGHYNKTVDTVGGYFGVITGIIAFYVATAELTNEVYRREILPLGVFQQNTAEPAREDPRPDTL